MEKVAAGTGKESVLPLEQPNSEVRRLPEAGHLVIKPSVAFSQAEVAELLEEARSDAPKWGNIFNAQAPHIPVSACCQTGVTLSNCDAGMDAVSNRPPDDDSRRAAYGLNGEGKQCPGQTSLQAILQQMPNVKSFHWQKMESNADRLNVERNNALARSPANRFSATGLV